MIGARMRVGRPSRAPATSVNALAAALFRNGEQGWWFDNNDLSTMFQDSAGTIPVTGPGQPVGLQLDKSRGLVRGVELLVNNSFDSGATNWTDISTGTGTFTVGSGTATIVGTSDANRGRFEQAINTVSGKFYEVTFSDIVGVGSATAAARTISGNAGAVLAAVLVESVQRFIFSAQGPTSYIVFSTNAAGGTFNIPEISVKELPGNHRYQTTAASRPILRQNATTGAYYLETDGVDDWMQTNAINFTSTDKVMLFAGAKKLSDAATGTVAGFGLTGSESVGGFELFAPSQAGVNKFAFGSKGATTQVIAAETSQTFSAPVSVVVSCAANIASPFVQLSVNRGALRTGTLWQGGGTYGNYPAYFFRRGGTTLPFNGHEYSSICVGRLCTAAEIAAVERLLAQRVGVQLA